MNGDIVLNQIPLSGYPQEILRLDTGVAFYMCPSEEKALTCPLYYFSREMDAPVVLTESLFIGFYDGIIRKGLGETEEIDLSASSDRVRYYPGISSHILFSHASRLVFVEDTLEGEAKWVLYDCKTSAYDELWRGTLACAGFYDQETLLRYDPIGGLQEQKRIEGFVIRSKTVIFTLPYYDGEGEWDGRVVDDRWNFEMVHSVLAPNQQYILFFVSQMIIDAERHAVFLYNVSDNTFVNVSDLLENAKIPGSKNKMDIMDIYKIVI